MPILPPSLRKKRPAQQTFLAVWSSHLYRDFSASRQIKIVPSLNVHRPGAAAGANYGANRGAFAASRDCSDDGPDRGPNRCALDRLCRLTLLLNGPLVVNPRRLAVGRPN